MRRTLIVLSIVFALFLAPAVAADNETTFGVRFDHSDSSSAGTGTWELLAGITDHQQLGFAFGAVYGQNDATGRTLYYQLGPAYELQFGRFIIGGLAQAYLADPDAPDWSATARAGLEFGDTAFVKVFVDYTRAWTDSNSDGSVGAAAQIGLKF